MTGYNNRRRNTWQRVQQINLVVFFRSYRRPHICRECRGRQYFSKNWKHIVAISSIFEQKLQTFFDSQKKKADCLLCLRRRSVSFFRLNYLLWGEVEVRVWAKRVLLVSILSRTNTCAYSFNTNVGVNRQISYARSNYSQHPKTRYSCSPGHGWCRPGHGYEYS